MRNILKVDLRIARQRSGLSSQDVATLLGTSRTRVSKLENGVARLRVREIVAISIIYGKPLEGLLRLYVQHLAKKVRTSLASLDFSHDEEKLATKIRLDTLNNLSSRLEGLLNQNDG